MLSQIEVSEATDVTPEYLADSLGLGEKHPETTTTAFSRPKRPGRK